MKKRHHQLLSYEHEETKDSEERFVTFWKICQISSCIETPRLCFCAIMLCFILIIIVVFRL